jgi:tRNA 2-thiouridine synthesizing protein A
MSARTVDARGTRCPYPVVELARAATAGGLIELLSDDPVSLTDVPAWCRIRGADLLEVTEESGYWRFVVRAHSAG